MLETAIPDVDYIRSLKQNKYYWGYLVPAFMRGLLDAGHEPEYIGNKDRTHEFIKWAIMPPRLIRNSDGYYSEARRTTTTMSKRQFLDYIDHIQRTASTFLNIHLRDPYESELTDFK